MSQRPKKGRKRRFTVTLCTPYVSWEGVEATSKKEAIEMVGLPPGLDPLDGPIAWVVEEEKGSEEE